MKMTLPKDETESPTPKKGGGSAASDAAADVLKAIKANDARALSAALTRHYEACSDEDY
jgi:hypothetical protein